MNVVVLWWWKFFYISFSWYLLRQRKFFHQLLSDPLRVTCFFFCKAISTVGPIYLVFQQTFYQFGYPLLHCYAMANVLDIANNFSDSTDPDKSYF